MNIDELIGAKVRYTNGFNHKNSPWFYPSIGTEGIVKRINKIANTATIHWEDGSTSGNDIWVCDLTDIEVIDHNKTINNTSWIEKLGYGGWDDIHWECDSCHKDYFFKEGTPLQNDWHFCPKCGVKKVNEIRIGENLEDESE